MGPRGVALTGASRADTADMHSVAHVVRWARKPSSHARQSCSSRSGGRSCRALGDWIHICTLIGAVVVGSEASANLRMPHPVVPGPACLRHSLCGGVLCPTLNSKPYQHVRKCIQVVLSAVKKVRHGMNGQPLLSKGKPGKRNPLAALSAVFASMKGMM